MSGQGPPETLRTIPDAIAHAERDRPDQPVLRHHDRKLTNADLAAAVAEIGGGFHAHGIEPGDHVGLYAYNSLEYVLAWLALANLGAVTTPIDTRFTGNTLEHVIREADVESIVLDPQTGGDFETVREHLSDPPTAYFVGDRAPETYYRDFDALREAGPSSPPDVPVAASDTATLTYLQQTRTQSPRGVLLPQFSYVNTGWEAAHNLFEYGPDDRLFTTLPLYSVFTFQIGVMGALVSEASFVIGDGFDADRFWDQVRAYDATIFLYLSRMLSVLHNQATDEATANNPAELAIGGSPGLASDEDLFRAFEERFDITVLEGYGTTPVSAIATFNRLGDRRLDSMGKPPSYCEVRIVDDDDWPVPAGETGEIVVRPTRPHTMMEGYYDNPVDTVETWRNQWIHSGGIGYLDEDGYVHFVARKENSIDRGRVPGRISSLEIESVIDAIDGVRSSAVVGLEDESGGEEIKAVVVTDDGDLGPVDICQGCERELPYPKVPRYIEIREEFPRTSAGKVDKRELKAAGPGGVWDRERGYELSR